LLAYTSSTNRCSMIPTATVSTDLSVFDWFAVENHFMVIFKSVWLVSVIVSR